MKRIKYLLVLILLFSGCSKKFNDDIELNITPDNIKIHKYELYNLQGVKLTFKNNSNKSFILFGVQSKIFQYPPVSSEDDLLKNILGWYGLNIIVYDSKDKVCQPPRVYYAASIGDSIKDTLSLDEMIEPVDSGKIGTKFGKYSLKLLPKQTIILNAKLRVNAYNIYYGGKFALFGYYLFKQTEGVYIDKKFLDGKYGEVFEGVIKSNKINVSVE